MSLLFEGIVTLVDGIVNYPRTVLAAALIGTAGYFGYQQYDKMQTPSRANSVFEYCHNNELEFSCEALPERRKIYARASISNNPKRLEIEYASQSVSDKPFGYRKCFVLIDDDCDGTVDQVGTRERYKVRPHNKKLIEKIADKAAERILKLAKEPKSQEEADKWYSMKDGFREDLRLIDSDENPGLNRDNYRKLVKAGYNSLKDK